jgi:hypothetical protein
MKLSIGAISAAVIVFVVSGASPLWAQTGSTADAALAAGGLSLAGGYGDDYQNGYHATTAAEGFFRGIADGIRSLGLARLLSSEAMINEQEAYRRGLENARASVNTYFDNRQVNRERRALERGPRPSAEDYARYARMGKPRLLSPSELDPLTGDVEWPILLRMEEFDSQRLALDQVFSRWATSGTLSYDDFFRVRQITANMLDDLRGRIRVLPPSQYVVAMRFLESMSFEAGQPSRQLKGPAVANVGTRPFMQR